MSSIRALILCVLLLIVKSLRAEEATTPISSTTPIKDPEIRGVANEKISRRLIDERLSPPRTAEFSLWNNRVHLADLQRLSSSPPRSVANTDDNITDKSVPKKIRTVGATQESGCCGSKLPGANGFSEEKDKSQQKQTLEELDRDASAGPALRFHGNNPSDDRYGQGWRSFNYIGYGKDRNYYDRRNYHPYERYNTPQRPSSSYVIDGDRYGTVQRPGSGHGIDGDRYTTSSSNRPGSFQSINYAFGHGPIGTYDRPRPGNFGATASVGSEGDIGEYPYQEGGPFATGSNLQTQKAVALKALAGVALIGAAAALATNPVFLPISVLSGRRKRSAGVELDNYTLTALLQGYIQPTANKMTSGGGSGDAKDTRGKDIGKLSSRRELFISPQCVARLACHVHRDYLEELDKAKIELSLARTTGKPKENSEEATLQGLEHWFDSLVHNNILVSDYLSDELKSLIQSAVAVGSNKNASCNRFSCLNVYDSLNKRKT